MNPTATDSLSPLRLALRRFRRNRLALACAGLLVFTIAATIVVPMISIYAYDEQDREHAYHGPDAYNWMGTDALGRDLLTRTFYGGRISFLVGAAATAVSLLLGVAYGAAAGYRGGAVDNLLMRAVDVLYGLPFMFLVILLVTLFERSILLLFVALGAVQWLTMARIVRGQVLSLREREFVEGARALGLGAPAILVRHILPNLVGPVVVYATLLVPTVMLEEAFLSFLGLGIREPETSWGVLLSEGQSAISPIGVYWWMILFPAFFLALTLFCLNVVGDGLRDAFDVRSNRPT